jgi:uncharacterized repeat protein (TIGR03803 family)
LAELKPAVIGIEKGMRNFSRLESYFILQGDMLKSAISLLSIFTALFLMASADAQIESSLYSFSQYYNDGYRPSGLTLSADGKTLYGTTSNGGASGVGAIFAYNISTGTETILYSFSQYYNDGYRPSGLTLSADGKTLYGTTANGGASGVGAIFAYNISTGTETILYSFSPYYNDGTFPTGVTLTADGKTLYGTTSSGGASGVGAIFVFRLPLPTPTVSFTQPISPVAYSAGKSFSLITTSTSGGVVTYTSSNTNVISITGSTALVKGIGTATITATVAATGNYTSASASCLVTVTRIIPTISFTQPISPVAYSAGKSFSLSTTSTSGGVVTYTSSNTNVISITGSTALVKGTGTATITATVAATGNYGSGNATRSVTVK